MPAPLAFPDGVKLTGRTRHRPAWFGRLVLQVELEYRLRRWGQTSGPMRYWRDATVLDLQALGATEPAA